MTSIANFSKFLNSRYKYHSRKSTELEDINPRSSALHRETADQHKSILDWFSEYLEDPPITRKSIDDLFSINPLDLGNLDDDVRDQLSVSDSDVNDAQILELLDMAGRPLDLNEIIVGSFRKYGTKHKRPQLTARIHRLVSKQEIQVVGKGRYKLAMEDLEIDADDDSVGIL